MHNLSVTNGNKAYIFIRQVIKFYLRSVCTIYVAEVFQVFAAQSMQMIIICSRQHISKLNHFLRFSS